MGGSASSQASGNAGNVTFDEPAPMSLVDSNADSAITTNTTTATRTLSDTPTPASSSPPAQGGAEEKSDEQYSEQNRISEEMATSTQGPTIMGYEVGDKLGNGGFGTVFVGVNPRTKQQVALKCYKRLEKEQLSAKEKKELKQITAEISALSQIKHKHVIGMIGWDMKASFPGGWVQGYGNTGGYYEVASGQSSPVYCFALELGQSEDLMDMLMYFTGHKIQLPEDLARTYFHHLIDGLDACHKCGYAHRDLKLDNLILGLDNVLKIADFGLSKIFNTDHGNTAMYTHCGTKGYKAPEVIMEEYMPGTGYDEKCDIWSAGIILFNLLTGQPALGNQDATRANWYANELHKPNGGRFWDAHDRTCTVSKETKAFILRMLVPDVARRPTIEVIRSDPWYNRKTLTPDECAKTLSDLRTMVAKARREAILARKKQAAEMRRFQHVHISDDDSDTYRAIGSASEDDKYRSLSEPTFGRHDSQASRSSDLDTMADKTVGDWGSEPRHGGNVNSFGFQSEETPREVLNRIILAARKVTGYVKSILDKENYSLEVHTEKIRFQVSLTTPPPNTSSEQLTNVSFRRLHGESQQFVDGYNKIVLNEVVDIVFV